MDFVKKVNGFLEQVNVENMTASDDDPKFFSTVLVRGSSATWVSRHLDWECDDVRLRTPLVKIPHQNLMPLYRHLLETNHSLGGEFTFGVDGDVVFGIETISHIGGIAYEEFMERIEYFTKLADRFDDEIASRFGATHIGYSELGL